MTMSSSDLFMFSPFFFLGNVDPEATGKRISALGMPELLSCWDADIREKWNAIMLADRLTKARLVGLYEMTRDMLSVR